MSDKALTPLATAALSLLVERPMHPYEMFQLLMHRQEDRLVKVRPGSLYHAVARLAEQGLVESIGVDRGGNRPERTTYRITGQGLAKLSAQISEWLAVPVNEYPRFPLAIAEAHNLARADVIGLLGTRIRVLNEELDGITMLVAGLERMGLDRQYYLDVRYQQRHLEVDIEWLRAVVADLENKRLAWTESPRKPGESLTPDTPKPDDPAHSAPRPPVA